MRKVVFKQLSLASGPMIGVSLTIDIIFELFLSIQKTKVYNISNVRSQNLSNK